MQPRKWIISAMAATMLTIGGVGGALAAEGSAKVVVTSPTVADVQAVKDVYNRLLAQGYDYIRVGRSLLGRAVVDAWNGIEKREVVINTKSGEIIHDMTIAAANYPAAAGKTADAAFAAAGDALDNAKDATSDALTRAGDATTTAAGHARDGAKEALDSAKDAAHRAGSAAKGMFSSGTGGGNSAKDN